MKLLLLFYMKYALPSLEIFIVRIIGKICNLWTNSTQEYTPKNHYKKHKTLKNKPEYLFFEKKLK